MVERCNCEEQATCKPGSPDERSYIRDNHPGYRFAHPGYQLIVIARSEATKQSIYRLSRAMDRFASLAMTILNGAGRNALAIYQPALRRNRPRTSPARFLAHDDVRFVIPPIQTPDQTINREFFKSPPGCKNLSSASRKKYFSWHVGQIIFMTPAILPHQEGRRPSSLTWGKSRWTQQFARRADRSVR